MTQHSALPNEIESHLLRAALLDGDAALAAYSAWRQVLDIDALDFGSQRVLPILCKNLRAHGVDDPLMARFQGVTRYAWYSNSILTAAAKPVLKAFTERRIPVVPLKGMAFIASLPSQQSLRAMTDIDLLVRPPDAPAAVDALIACGWRPHVRSAGYVKREVIPQIASFAFKRGERQDIDLHWYLLEQNRWLDADDVVWGRLLQVQLGGEPCQAPSFEDQLLHACVHGAPWSGYSSLRWATDASAILRANHTTFEWDYLVEQTRRRRVILQMRNCLEYLHATLEIPVPDAALAALRRQRATFIEIADYRLRTRGMENLTHRQQELLALQHHRGSSQALLEASTFTALVSWMRDRLALDSPLATLAWMALAKLGRPPRLRELMHRIWRNKWRDTTLERRQLPKISDGPLDLSQDGDADGALLYGWSCPELDGRWTDGPEAACAVDLGPGCDSLRVTFLVHGLVVQEAPTMNVEIWANDRRLPDWKFQLQHIAPHSRCLEIPKSALKGRFLVLSFVIREPRTPKSLRLSSDNRRLGIFIRSISFEEKSHLIPRAGGEDFE